MVLDANDREVIEACQRGDYDAFGALFEAYKDHVYSIALRFSGDPSTAMDIAQATLLKVFSRIKDFRGDARFDSWLYRLAGNSCLYPQKRGPRPAPRLPRLVDFFCAPH